jgi:predicted nucleotidyltransferase
MKTLEKIKKIIQEHRKELEAQFNVIEIGIFGSYVHGNQSKKSDIDILVELKEPVSLLKLVSLENYLEEITGIKVDVVPKNDVRPELKKQILEEVAYL